MSGSLSDRLRELEDESSQWLHNQSRQTPRSLAELEQAGRDAWNAATRAGVDLAGRTPQELRALGARVLAARGNLTGAGASHGVGQIQGRQPAPADGAIGIAKPSFIDDGRWNALMQADAAVRGAANTLTFGGADHFAAAMDALTGGGVDGWYDRYKADLGLERARNQYDAANRPTAQKIGQMGGTLLGLGLAVPESQAIGFGARLPGAAPLTGREITLLLGAGAGAGVASQTASDMATGQTSSFGDKVAAAAGGATNVAALPLGPGRAGALGGWVTSAGQDLFNGRPIDWGRAGQSAMAGGLLGDVAGDVGTSAADGLSSAAKGRLGETLGNLRSAIGGEPRQWAPKARDYLADGSYWYPDGLSGTTRFEDKFGYKAELSPNQTQAQATLGSNFKLFHFLPDDIGWMASVPAATFGQQIINSPDASH